MTAVSTSTMNEQSEQPAIARLSEAPWPSRVAVVLFAALLTLAFPEPGLWWLGWFGLTPVIVLIVMSRSHGEALFRSWLGGVGFLTALHYWVIPHTGVFTAVLAPFVGFFWLPLGLACRWSMRPTAPVQRQRLALLLVPSVWVLMEVVRSWEYLGGTWGLLGLSQWRSGPVLQSAALGGVWLLSFVMAAVNVALASASLPGRGW